MSTIVTRSGKGSPLTHTEVDDNFTNLNTDKYQEGSAIGAVTPAAGTFTTLTATGQTSLGGAAGSEAFRAVTTASGVNWLEGSGGATGSSNWPRLFANGSDSTIFLNLSAKGSSGVRFWTSATSASSGNEQFRVSATASAVNYVQVTGAATTASPTISAQGSDTNVALKLSAKGSQVVQSTSWFQAGTSQANYLQLAAANTSFSPVLSVQGTDTNISQVFQSKGTGAIDLAAGSSGVNISNGGTVTAITRTASGTNYTSKPSIAITAPTTAGGVQAVLSVDVMTVNTTAGVQSGGTGYTNGDVLTVVGGTNSGGAALITVTGVSGGVITSATTNNSDYSVLPTNPVSVTGGTGSGATFNLTWIVKTLSVTTAGSGYVEQPTVSFSGGGGSGAAAYATVGSNSKVTSTGSNLSFYMPAGEILRLSDQGVASPAYMQVQSGGSGVLFYSAGPTNSYMYFVSKGTSQISFATNNSASNEQLRVAHTASAVNYVQVTGAATGGRPVISAQGSDNPISFDINAKGSAGVVNIGNGGTYPFFKVQGVSGQTVVNYLTAIGTQTAVSPALTVAGSDTNASMVLQPRGTGAIDLAAGSSGVNISNGGTVTAITRTASGVYTSIPAATISAPTTAGGVQATGDVAVEPSTFTIVSGGSGYAVNDIVEISGGTFYTQRTRLTVSSVSAGTITGVTISTYGRYTVLPSSPNAVTTITGTGSGATITIVNSTVFSVNITNAGSGYVEQPTVSFSGGGGSGAAAYATVGSGTTVKSIGSTLSFYTPNGEAFRVADSGATSGFYWQAFGGSGNPILRGSGASASSLIQSAGTGSVTLQTNSGVTQMAVAHTASAVNYVQVTGAATGGRPTISAQGSDTNINTNISTKGSGIIYLNNGSGTGLAVFASGSANYGVISGRGAGTAPTYGVDGSDTNIDLALTPKGTGAVLMGTTASNGGISGAAPIAVMYQPTSSRHGFVASVASTGYDVGLVWNRSNSGNNRLFEFATEGTYTPRGSIDYDRTGGVIRYNTTSDQRLKKNISDSISAIAEVMSLKVRQFDWKETNNHVDFGFIAQELLETCPSAVSVGEDAEDGSLKRPWGIDTSQLVPILVKAVQEQQAIIEQLKADVAILKAI